MPEATEKATAVAEKPKRRLKTALFFPFLRVVRAIDGPRLVQEFTRLQKRAEDAKAAAGDDFEALEEAQMAMGMEIAQVVLDVLPDAEDEVMEFLARYTGLTREELEDQDLLETINEVIELVRDPRFMDFFRSAVKGNPLNS